MMISTFKKANQPGKPIDADIDDIVMSIEHGGKGGWIKKLIEQIRSTTDKDQKRELKKQLPIVTFSGRFSYRSEEKLIEHSGLIVLDLDGIDESELQQLNDKVKADKYTFISFVSPSKGLKVVVKIPAEPDNHRFYFQGLCEHYIMNYVINPDPSGKDYSRACFLSYDPEIYHNPDSETFTTKVDLKERSIPKASQSYGTEKMDDVDALHIISGWIDKSEPFVDGNKHRHMICFLFRANEAGISEENAAAYYDTNYDKKKVFKNAQNIYNSPKAKASFGTNPIFKNRKTKKEAVVKKNDGKMPEYQTFWNSYLTKRGKLVVSFSRHKFLNWLKINGWARYHSTLNDWELIFVKNNIVEKRSKSQLKEFVMDYVNSLPEVFDEMDRTDLIEMIVKGNAKYFGNDSLEFLPCLKISTHMDTVDSGWMFYQNTAVKITSNNIELIPYSKIGTYIWKEQVLKRDFEMDGDLQNDFCKFLMIVAGSERVDDIQNEKYQNRLKAFESSIGYLLHGYKNSALCPVIILNDAYNLGGEPRGGTGKGVLLRAIRYMRDTAMFDGKNWKQDSTFAFQMIGPSTQIAAFEDIKPNFDFEGFFSVITEGFNVEKKGRDAYKIPFEISPKIIMTTNYPVKGDGSSHERRRVELELDDFFITHPPYEYFGHRLFDDWDADHWKCFDRYMTYCLQVFLRKSIIKLDLENLEYRKLRELTNPIFIEWVTDWIQPGTFPTARVKELLSSYNSDFSKYNQRTITSWMYAFLNYYKMDWKKTRQRFEGRTVQAISVTTTGDLPVVSCGNSGNTVVTKDDIL